MDTRGRACGSVIGPLLFASGRRQTGWHRGGVRDSDGRGPPRLSPVLRLGQGITPASAPLQAQLSPPVSRRFVLARAGLAPAPETSHPASCQLATPPITLVVPPTQNR